MSLTDVFMPEDLCARCAVEEPTSDIKVLLMKEDEQAFVFFCTELCKDVFVKGWESVQGLGEDFQL